jgi:hypothetical protein
MTMMPNRRHQGQTHVIIPAKMNERTWFNRCQCARECQSDTSKKAAVPTLSYFPYPTHTTTSTKDISDNAWYFEDARKLEE